MNAGVATTSVLWRSEVLESTERFTGTTSPDGHRLSGCVVLPLAGDPTCITYEVALDASWRTRRAVVHVDDAGGRRTIRLRQGGGGGWSVEGAPSQSVDGCVDVDLGFTPATNTLQIRRLDLAVGESHSLPVALLTFPELQVERLTQTYTRLGEQRWLYGSDDFRAELDVDDDGFVLRYGDDIWRAVAHRKT